MMYAHRYMCLYVRKPCTSSEFFSFAAPTDTCSLFISRCASAFLFVLFFFFPFFNPVFVVSIFCHLLSPRSLLCISTQVNANLIFPFSTFIYDILNYRILQRHMRSFYVPRSTIYPPRCWTTSSRSRFRNTRTLAMEAQEAGALGVVEMVDMVVAGRTTLDT